MTDAHDARPDTVLYDADGRPTPRSSGRTHEAGIAVCVCGAVSTTLTPEARTAWIEEHRAAVRWEIRNGWRASDGEPIGPLEPPTA